MRRAGATEVRIRRIVFALAFGVLLAALVPVAAGAVAGPSGLEAKLKAARSQAGDLAAQLRAKQEQLGAAEQEAAAAGARERRLSGLLAHGEEHAAELGERVLGSRRRLGVEQRRLRRARSVLADRLVAIYETGTPDTASIVLASDDYEDLITHAEYLDRVEASDNGLASRVAQVRGSVRRTLGQVTSLKARADAYNERLAAARTQISAVRESAVASSAQLQAVSAEREASLASLKSDIGNWVDEVQAARAAAAEEASRATAESEVDRWLGGPYSIPTYIVMCESGGNYGAVNPSSGAGGAYQILPSTWQLYGGKGSPESAPKAEQDAIAAQIWADSGPGAWVCG